MRVSGAREIDFEEEERVRSFKYLDDIRRNMPGSDVVWIDGKWVLLMPYSEPYKEPKWLPLTLIMISLLTIFIVVKFDLQYK